MISRTLLCALSSLLLQATSPQLLGDIAEKLGSSDLETIARVLPAGFGNPWMLFGLHRGGGRDFFDVYGPPSPAASDLRRGRFLRFFWSPGLRGLPLESVPPMPSNYAQVAVPGRGFEVRDVKDLNRPFEVIGVIDDGDLRSIVALLRSQPYPSAGNRQVPACPILSITKNEGSDSVVVRLDPETQPRPGGIARVLLGKANGVWFVSQLVMGQA